jgi:26S proteasome regulatory subunit N10
LALKHRQNKLQKQHIIVFIASPIEETTQALVRLARKLKKNNISIDVVNFGETAANTSKLEEFMTTIDTETSHLVTVAPGSYLLSDMLLSSPILMGEDGAPPPGMAPGMGGDASGFEFGIDPSLDPELALALRMSLEEENARQQAEAQRAAMEAGTQESQVEGSTVPDGGEKKDRDEEDGAGNDSMHIE